jgi:biopolymer transport protein ExbD
MNIRRKLRTHAEVHTGPLNDILFILLLFFLIASTLANPNLKKVNNPQGDKDMKARQNIIVSIDKDQNFYIGTQLVPPGQLDTLLGQAIANARKTIDTPSIIINADTLSYTGAPFKIIRLAKRNNAKVAWAVK